MNIEKTYIYANSQIMAQHDGDHNADRYFYLHDRLGSVRQVIDSSAVVVRMFTFNPFGETIEDDGSFYTPWRFSGQFFDDEIDQYYLRARQYDPYLSRFISRDPVFGEFKEPLTLHKYLYCINNPMNKIDPAGLWAMYLTLTGSAQFAVATGGQVGLAWDDNGNVGVITIENYGVGTPQVTLGASFGWSPVANTIFSLSGWGWASGGSFGPVGFEGFLGDNGVWGYEFTLGHSLIPLPEGHFFRTKTTITPIKDLNWHDISSDIRGDWDDSMYEAKTLGEFYMWSIADNVLDEL